MCDYCGCRETEPIAELSEEHAHLENLGTRLRNALQQDDDGTARALLARIVGILDPHVRKEERGLFSHMLDEGAEYETVVEGLIGEHIELEHAIARLGDTLDRGAVLAFLEALDEHIFKEEWDLFPAAMGLLSYDALQAISEVHDEEGSALDDRRRYNSVSERACASL
jgi:hemerythrin-like domain-containing protein